MKKIWVLGTAVLILFLSAVMSQAETASEGADTAELAGLLLTWQDDPTSTMTIDWHFGVSAESTTLVPEASLAFKRVGADEWRTVDAETLPPILPQRIIFRVELTGLEAGAFYRFRLAGHDETFQFRTMPAKLDEPLVFVVGGDTRHQQDWMEEMNRAAMLHEPEFIVWGGDLAYADGVHVDRWYEWFNANLNTLVTNDGRVIPVVLGIGNHEVQSGFYRSHAGYEETDAWRERIAPFFYGLFAFPGHPGYGVLDFGDYLSLVVLDTDHTNSISGEQLEWLERVLAERQDVPYLLPIYHVPGYPSVRSFTDSSQTRVREHWVPLFERYGVRLAFEHHDHAYKRTVPIRAGAPDPSGIVYVGDGAWGVGTRPVHPVDSTWYLARAGAVRHGIVVTLDGGDPQLLVVDSQGEVVDEFAVNGVFIESPQDQATVGPDEPIRIAIDPAIHVAAVQVAYGGETIYLGAQVPQDLNLSAVVPEDEAWQRLTVTVTDDAGKVREQAVDFRVRRLHLRLPESGLVRVSGDLDVVAGVGLAAGEEIAKAQVIGQRILAFEETEAFPMWEGTQWPGELSIDTRHLDDGTYDITLVIETTAGIVSSDVRRIRLQNWDILDDPFEPPLNLFGSLMDRSKTTERSDGWVYLSDDPANFFGDRQRLGYVGESAGYLVWEKPRLARFQFTVYALHEALDGRIHVAVSEDQINWHRVPVDVAVAERAASGWLMLHVSGEVPPQVKASSLRFELQPAQTPDERVQLGHARFLGRMADAE